jgi:N-methylhydantoinase B
MGSMIPNVETMESRAPELVVYRRQRADSQGHGRFRGGAGIEMALVPHKNPEPLVHVVISAFNSQPDNQGISGGTPAAVNYSVVLRGSEARELFAAGRIPTDAREVACDYTDVLPAKAHTHVDDGDLHLYLQTGGGGYGDPLRRDPELVLHDVRRGLVSEAVACAVYGVDPADPAASERLREQIRARRLAEASDAPVVRAAGGELLHPVADTLEAVRVDGEALIRCSVCQTRLSAYGDNWKQGAVWRERSFRDLNDINEVAPETDLVAREFYCPGCGTALALDIQPAGQGLLPECSFGDERRHS